MDFPALSTDLIATPPKMADLPAPAPVGEEAIAFHALLSAVKQGFAQLIPPEEAAASGKDLPATRQAKAEEDAGDDAPLEAGIGDGTTGDADEEASIWLPPSAMAVEAMPPKPAVATAPPPVDGDAPRADQAADADQPVRAMHEGGRARRHDADIRPAVADRTATAIAAPIAPAHATETPDAVIAAPIVAAPAGRTRASERMAGTTTAEPAPVAGDPTETTVETVDDVAPAVRTAAARAAFETRPARTDPPVNKPVAEIGAEPLVHAPAPPRGQAPRHAVAATPPAPIDADAPAAPVPMPAPAIAQKTTSVAATPARAAPSVEALPEQRPARETAPAPATPPSSPGAAVVAGPATTAASAPAPLPSVTPPAPAPATATSVEAQPVPTAAILGDVANMTAPAPRTRAPLAAAAAIRETPGESETLGDKAPVRRDPAAPAPAPQRSHDVASPVIAQPARVEPAVATAPAPVDMPPPAPIAAVSVAAPVLQAATPAPTIVQAMPPLDTTRADWIAALVDRIDEARGADGVSATSMKLRPEALGLLEVRIRIEGEQTHVHFRTENPVAHALITDAAQRLGDMVEARGLKLGQTQVDLSSGNPGGQRRDEPAPEERQRPNLRNPNHPSASSDAAPTARERLA